jgi:predicted alpha/beta hydrolase family esterase
MKFVIFHGAFGSPQSNWFPELKEKLLSLDQEVITPKLPVENWQEVIASGQSFDPNNQNLNNWLLSFEKETLPKLKPNDKLCFVGHSLAPVFILHIIDKYKIKLDSAIFVSPFMDRLNNKEHWQFDVVNASFYKTDFDFNALKKCIPTSYVLYSSDDPYVSNAHSVLFAKALDSSTILVKRAGHMNSEVNLNEFPLVFELCKSRIDMTLYQRYLEHRKDLFATNYFKGKHEEIVYLHPEEIFEEGRFHFRNLSNSGFCTFLTSLSFWDAQGLYYEEARKAAQRVKNFTRVFVINSVEDLRKPMLLKHIELDLKAGIQVYFVMQNQITEIPEPDFGVWDDDYLCIVSFREDKQIEVKLSSRKKDIKEANKWKNIILEKAQKIANTSSNIESFIKMYR